MSAAGITGYRSSCDPVVCIRGRWRRDLMDAPSWCVPSWQPAHASPHTVSLVFPDKVRFTHSKVKPGFRSTFKRQESFIFVPSATDVTSRCRLPETFAFVLKLLSAKTNWQQRSRMSLASSNVFPLLGCINNVLATRSGLLPRVQQQLVAPVCTITQMCTTKPKY